MNGFLDTWYVSAVPTVVAVGMSLWSATQMRGALGTLGEGLRRRDQLPAVKGAIEANMRLAALYVLFYAALLALLFAAVARGWFGLLVGAGHLMVFSLITGPFGLWTRQFEKRLQTLDTAGAEQGVDEVYARWLAEWKKPRLRLSEP